jgi:hypothetical protein
LPNDLPITGLWSRRLPEFWWSPIGAKGYWITGLKTNWKEKEEA